MRNISSTTSELDQTLPDAAEAPATRRSNRHSMKRRRALLAAGAVAAVGAVIAGGFAVQGAVAADERRAATAALTNSTGLHSDQLGAYAAVAAAKAISHAEDTLTVANDALAAAEGKVDATGLAATVASLSEYRTLPTDEVVELTRATQEQAGTVQASTVEFDRQAAEAAAAAAAAAAEAQARANTAEGAKATAREMAASKYGWGESQFSCLVSLWQKESNWNYAAYNASSGATGIPQSLPGSKMASAGADWATNATTQIAWGLDYIARGYGTPCSAWSHSQSVNWY